MKLISLFLVVVFNFSVAAVAQETKFEFAVGGGVVGGPWSWNQKMVNQIYPSVVRQDAAATVGLRVFLDVTQFFTLNFGARVVPMDIKQNYSYGTYNLSWDSSNSISQLEMGAELKIPLYLFNGFSLAPKVGLAYLCPVNSQIAGSQLTSYQIIEFSPLYVTTGLDLNFHFGRNLFFRVPLTIGQAINTQLPDAYYSNYASTYSSSQNISSEIGFEFGYIL